MKITHLCLGCFYIEGAEYQENVLPRKHKQLGYDVSIVSSTYCFTSDGIEKQRPTGKYINNDGIPVTIINYNKKFKDFSKTYKIYENLYNVIFEEKPDIIFIHGAQFFSVGQVVRYKRKFPNVKIFADQHSDYINTPVNTWKRKLFYRYVGGYFVRKIANYVEKFWGVTPLRVKFLQDVYKLKPNITDLLVMGGDEAKIDFINKEKIRKELRENYNISEEDFLIVTGGKIDRRKNIHMLMQAVCEMDMTNVKLVIFGQPNDEMHSIVDVFSKNDNIRLVGWIPAVKAYDWFLSSDLAVFPGTHSVLWEQAIACGLPGVFKYWEGMTHVNIGGNCIFLKEDSVEEIKVVLKSIIEDKPLYNYMKNISQEKGIKAFSYLEIAKKSIGLEVI